MINEDTSNAFQISVDHTFFLSFFLIRPLIYIDYNQTYILGGARGAILYYKTPSICEFEEASCVEHAV